jgi:hypothetical protein
MGAQEDYARFSELAEELGFEEKEHENFVNKAMAKKGYKPVMNWTDPEPEGNEGESSSFFGSGGNRSQQRRNVGGGGRERSGGSGRDYYGSSGN